MTQQTWFGKTCAVADPESGAECGRPAGHAGFHKAALDDPDCPVIVFTGLRTARPSRAARNAPARDIKGVTQSDLAHLIGESRPYTSTIINQRFKKARMAEMRGRTIVILDQRKLRKIASEEKIRT